MSSCYWCDKKLLLIYQYRIINIIFILGECSCLPGWMGKNCNTPCPSGRFGVNCTQHCKCLNNGKCRGNDGACHCAPGYTGTQCTESK